MEEEYSNGKIVETQRGETRPEEEEEEAKKLVVKDGEASSVKEELVIDGNNDVKEVEETEVVTENALPATAENSGFVEQVKEVTDCVGIVVPLPGESNVKLGGSDAKVQVVGADFEEETAPASNKSDVVVLDSGELSGDQEEAPVQFPSSSDKIGGDASEVDQKVSEGTKIESFDDGLSQVAKDVVVNEVEEEALATVDQNGGVHSVLTDVVPRELEGAKSEAAAVEQDDGKSYAVVEKDSAGHVGHLSETPRVSATIVGSSDGNPETTRNPPIISLSQRTAPRTSWRNCCGIFDVLRRSNR